MTSTRRYLARAVLTLPLLMAVSCPTTVEGTSGSVAAAGSSSPTASAATRTCRVTASAHRVRSTGSSRTVINSDGVSFSCGDGPLLLIARIGGGDVTFRLDGEETQVAAGSSATLGPYEVRVVSVDDGATTLVVDAPVS